MTAKALLIDANAAVQALALSALKQLGLEVKVCGEVQSFKEALQQERPNILLLASDVQNFDAVKFHEEISKDTKRPIAAIFLTPSGTESTLKKKIESRRLTTLLLKPFKSDQLKSVVTELLAALQSTPQEPVAVCIDDELSRVIIERFLQKKGLEVLTFSSGKALVKTAKERPLSAAICDLTHAGIFNKREQDCLGRMIVYTPASDIEKVQKAGFEVLVEPLSVDKLANCFSSNNSTLQQNSTLPNCVLQPGEQALLAAKISATLFERLLNQDALKHGRWEEASTVIGAEMLRICKSYRE